MSFKASRLKKEDRLSIAAPAGPFKKDLFLAGIKNIQKLGYKLHYRSDIFSKERFLAGSDTRRAKEIIEALRNKESQFLLFARGGYGCQRIVEKLPPQMSPKILIGSSDLTVLLNAVWQKYQIPSLYGPMVAPHFIHEENAQRLGRVLTDPDYFSKQKLKAKTIKTGKASGTIVGGCLSLVISTLQTPWEIDTDNKILILEDTQEAPYKVDRMLTQLIQAGKLSKVRGIVLGTFRLKDTLFPKEIKDVFTERLKNFKGPVLWGIPFGHCDKPLYVPIGLKGRIEEGRLFIEDKILRS